MKQPKCLSGLASSCQGLLARNFPARKEAIALTTCLLSASGIQLCAATECGSSTELAGLIVIVGCIPLLPGFA